MHRLWTIGHEQPHDVGGLAVIVDRRPQPKQNLNLSNCLCRLDQMPKPSGVSMPSNLIVYVLDNKPSVSPILPKPQHPHNQRAMRQGKKNHQKLWNQHISLVPPRTPEPAGATHALVELLDLDHGRRVDALDDELGDAVALLHLVVGLAVVEQQHLDVAAVVGVDDARARVDEVLGCQSGAWGDAAICLSDLIFFPPFG